MVNVTVVLPRPVALALLRLVERSSTYTHEGVAVSHAIDPLAAALGLEPDDAPPPAA